MADDGEAAPAPSPQPASGPRRMTMIVLLTAFSSINYSTRGALPQVMMSVAGELSLTTAQQATLLSAFYPVYVALMIPAGWLVRTWGPKNSVTLDLALHAIALLAFPAAGKAAGMAGMVACLGLLGASQTPIFPVLNTMKRDWLPTGPSRAVALQVMRVGGSTMSILFRWVVPRLTHRWGWQSVPWLLGGVSAGMGLIWHALAASRPTEASASTPPKETFNWSVLRQRVVLACIGLHCTTNNITYSVLQWSPTIYANLGCTPLQAGTYLAVPGMFGFCVNWVVAAVETKLMLMGVKDKAVRRWAALAACTWQAISVTLFGLADTALKACIANCSVVLGGAFVGSMTYAQSYYEIGGSDTALITSVANVPANTPGFIAASVGTMLLNRTGSLVPLFAAVGVLQFLGGLFYGSSVETTTVQELMAAVAAKKGA